MNRLADAMTPYLETSGINVSRNDPAGTVGNSIRMSNAGNYDFHLALHSNASPPATSGQQAGIDLYYYPSSAPALRMANILADNLRPIYPQPEKVRTLATTSLVEVRATRAPSWQSWATTITPRTPSGLRTISRPSPGPWPPVCANISACRFSLRARSVTPSSRRTAAT